MRFIFVLLATAVSSYFALLLMPWWTPMLIAFFLILMLPMNRWLSFLAPAIGAALTFLVLTFFRDLQNEHLLSTKIAEIFRLPSFVLLMAITVFIGFVTSGLGGLTAASLMLLLRSQPAEEDEQEEAIGVDS